MEKKHLKINAGVLSITGDKAKLLEQYESIKINTGLLIISPSNRAAMNARLKGVNMGACIEVPDGATVRMINGSADVTADDNVTENTALVVNGMLHLHEGTAEVLAKYACVHLNGQLYAPESMRCAAASVQSNGSKNFYPDGAEFIHGDLTIDRRFVKRASEDSFWYCTGNVFIVSPGIDVETLIEKNVMVHGEKAFVSVDYVDAALLFDSNTEIELVPSGYKFIKGDVNITADTADFYGGRLYIYGKVTADRDSEEGLENLEKVIVKGSAYVHEKVFSVWNSICTGCANVEVKDDAKVIGATEEVHVSRAMLAACPEGIRITEASVVVFDSDIEIAMLAARVRSISDCTCAVCTEEQQGVLQLVAEYVDFVRERPVKTKDEDGELEESSDTVKINAGVYSL